VLLLGGYAAFHKYVPKYEIAVYVVVKKRLDNQTFFDSHYTGMQEGPIILILTNQSRKYEIKNKNGLA